MLTRYLRQLPFIGLKTGLSRGGLHMYRHTHIRRALSQTVCVYLRSRTGGNRLCILSNRFGLVERSWTQGQVGTTPGLWAAAHQKSGDCWVKARRRPRVRLGEPVVSLA